MAKQTVNIGTSANKGNGDPLRTAFTKINNNFDELYSALGSDGDLFDPSSVDQSLVPTTTNTVDLGSASKQWRSLYVSNNTIYIGGVAIAVDNNGNLVADLKGSVFADDSTLMVDAVDNKIYATELTVTVGNFVNVNSNNVDVENINGLASQINFTVGGYNNLVIENNLVTIQNVSLSVAGDITLGGDIKSETGITIDINLSDSTLRRWRFGEDGNLETPGGVQVAGILKIDDGVHEKFQTKADATGVVTHDCSLGHIFYHTSPDANWTANFTNLNLSDTYATSVTLIIAQGATGYYPSAVQIAGVAQTINWQGNVNPTVSTNRTDVVTFSIINNSGTYTVLGQLTGF